MQIGLAKYTELVGKKVLICYDQSINSSYVPKVRSARSIHNGCIGIVTDFHNSHGLCYNVRCDDGSEPPYDACELIVIEDTKPKSPNNLDRFLLIE